MTGDVIHVSIFLHDVSVFSTGSSLVNVFGSTHSTSNAATLVAISKSIISLIVTHRYTILQATEET